MADLDPEVVRRMRSAVAGAITIADIGEMLRKAGFEPTDLRALLASWERRGEALGRVQEIHEHDKYGSCQACVSGELSYGPRLTHTIAAACSDSTLVEALRQIEQEGKSASDVRVLRLASVARAALEGKP